MGKTRPHERKRRACEFDAPRLLQVIDFFGSIPGGEIQIDQKKLQAATGIPIDSLKRHLEWACRYGAIERRYQYAFGSGRAPTIYESVIGLDEWMEVGPERVRRWQEEAARVPVGRVKGGNAGQLEPSWDIGAGWSDVK